MRAFVGRVWSFLKEVFWGWWAVVMPLWTLLGIFSDLKSEVLPQSVANEAPRALDVGEWLLSFAPSLSVWQWIAGALAILFVHCIFGAYRAVRKRDVVISAIDNSKPRIIVTEARSEIRYRKGIQPREMEKGEVSVGNHGSEAFLGVVTLKNDPAIPSDKSSVDSLVAEVEYLNEEGESVLPGGVDALPGYWSDPSPIDVAIVKPNPPIQPGPVAIRAGEYKQLFLCSRRRNETTCYAFGPESVNSADWCCALYRLGSLGPFIIRVRLTGEWVREELRFRLTHPSYRPALEHLDSSGSLFKAITWKTPDVDK